MARIDYSNRLDAELLRKAKQLALDTGKKTNDVIEDALRFYFEGDVENEGKDIKTTD